ncbi:MAG: hypothetical protein IKB99_02380 [Lentisphaeria bacterium]|nr:hypothetical protein [Lentisphaeria bacterium]
MFIKLLPKNNSPVWNLYMYNLFLGCALTIVSSFTFMDKLMLRMNIDLELLGTIKGVMFLLPAIIYQFIAVLLGKSQKEVQICAVSYFLRVLLPGVLPFLAMMTDDRKILTWWTIILLPAGMMFAVIANNTLMTIYRKVIPAEKYNYSIGMINMFFALATYLLGLPLAWVLDKMEHLSNFHFFLAFGISQLVTLAFEFPAIFCLLRVKVPRTVLQGTEKINMLAPYRDKKIRMVLLINILHRFVNGFMGAYITVYFIEVARFSMTTLLSITIALGMILTVTMPGAGKAMDRWGYGRFFIVLSGAMLLGATLFGLCWKSLLVLPVFALLCWDCNTNPAGGWMNVGEYSASSKLTSQKNLKATVAAYSICFNGGLSAGLLMGSALYTFAGCFGAADLSARLHTYFLLTLPFFGALFGASLYFNKLLADSEKNIKEA